MLKRHRNAWLGIATALALAVVLTLIAVASRTEDASANPAGGFASVSAGEGHTCAVTTTDGVKCWGLNDYGQLGDGTTTQRTAPVDVVGLASGVTAIAVGTYHTCALTTEGGMKCWGANSLGQLGDGTTTQRTSPVDVSGLNSGGAGITAGERHTCALTTSGGLKCWGNNHLGQLGDGTVTSRSVPADVVGLTSGVAGVSAGYWHSCAVTLGGQAKCWGANYNGQLGDGTTAAHEIPMDVSGMTSGVEVVAAGAFHNCALTTGGGVKCWGANFHGQLGNGTTTNSSPYGLTTPVDAQGLTSGVGEVAPGQNHTCAVTAGGGAKCWGSNASGELGDGTTAQSTTPVDVAGLASGVAGVSAGGLSASDEQYSCAVTTTGGAKCWGNNRTGQLGDGTTTNHLTPVDVLAGPKPTPTATPCPTGGCPTPTPTNTPTPTPLPPDFSIGINIDGGADDCNTSGGPTTCNAMPGSMFVVNFYLNNAGGYSYAGVSFYLQYTGMQFTSSMQNPNVVWPDCGFPVATSGPDYVYGGCGLGIGGVPSNYTGVITRTMFTCEADGSVTLRQGPGYTYIVDGNNIDHTESGPDETLTITCVPPAPYPTDTDGDGCPDTKEAGSNELAGGRRNYLNEWDYFNPTHDGQNRIDDILAVLYKYFIDQGNPSYTANTDRTLAGPNPWNAGPPNGFQRVDDILNARGQFFNDCS